MQSLMCQSWTGHQGVNTWTDLESELKIEKLKMETNIIYLSKIWNPKENNYLFNYLIETNGNMKENNYLYNYCLI